MGWGILRKIVIDTSAFMGAIQEIDDIKDECELIIPYVVLQELENHKDNYRDGKRSYLGRTGIKYIAKNSEHFRVVMTDNLDLPSADDKIIRVAKNEGASIATLDFAMRYKAKTKGIDSFAISFRDDVYRGYSIVDTQDNEVAKDVSRLYKDKEVNIFGLGVNEYLIIKEYGETKDILRWDGRVHRKLDLPKPDIVKGLNDLQRCAIDLLFNDSIPVKVIAGKFGSGKTLLSTVVGYHKTITKGLYSKLMFVRNTDMTEEGDIGFLPGTFEDKTDLLFQTMIQHLPQGIDTSDVLKRRGLLEMHIPYYMKGLSLNGFMIVDEAEDLTADTIKKIGTRLEENSAVVFCGDWEQAKGKFVTDSGMKQLVYTTKDNPLVGVVVLDDVVRSAISEVFADL